MLDFINDADTIRETFADCYRTTILAEETDPDKWRSISVGLTVTDSIRFSTDMVFELTYEQAAQTTS